MEEENKSFRAELERYKLILQNKQGEDQKRVMIE